MLKFIPLTLTFIAGCWITPASSGTISKFPARPLESRIIESQYSCMAGRSMISCPETYSCCSSGGYCDRNGVAQCGRPPALPKPPAPVGSSSGGGNQQNNSGNIRPPANSDRSTEAGTKPSNRNLFDDTRPSGGYNYLGSPPAAVDRARELTRDRVSPNR